YLIPSKRSYPRASVTKTTTDPMMNNESDSPTSTIDKKSARASSAEANSYKKSSSPSAGRQDPARAGPSCTPSTSQGIQDAASSTVRASPASRMVEVGDGMGAWV